jgi:hypothetical protein
MSMPGSYQLTINTPMGVQTPIMTITEEGGVFAGTMRGPTDVVQLEELSVAGADIAFKAEVPSPMGKFKLAFTCTVDGDTITGQCATPMGAIAFTGNRL